MQWDADKEAPKQEECRDVIVPTSESSSESSARASMYFVFLHTTEAGVPSEVRVFARLCSFVVVRIIAGAHHHNIRQRLPSSSLVMMMHSLTPQMSKRTIGLQPTTRSSANLSLTWTSWYRLMETVVTALYP